MLTNKNGAGGQYNNEGFSCRISVGEVMVGDVKHVNMKQDWLEHGHFHSFLELVGYAEN